MDRTIKDLKSIFDYDDYRAYMRDYYSAAKSQSKKFSFRYFSKAAGFASSGSILKVMKGDTNLSDEGIDKVAKALKLNRDESEFFKNLVHLNQATSADEKQFHASQILRSRTYRKIKPLSSSQFRFFSQWYYGAIRELIELPEFREDPKWIAERFYFMVTPKEAELAIEDMLVLGIIERDPSGRLKMTNAHISAGDEVSFSSAVHCHKQFLERASESMERVPREIRDISAVTIGVSREGAQRIKELIQEFRKEIVEVVHSHGSSEVVYQLNIQWFPLTREIKKDET